MHVTKNDVLQTISGKKIFGLFLLTNAVYVIMLAITIPMVSNYADGMALLDMHPTGYSAVYVNSLFDQLGEQGRSAYLYRQIPIDMIYPLLFASCYSLLFGYILKQLNKLNSFYSYICLLPIIAGTTDYLENFGIIKLLINYPELSQTTISFTNIFTITKSMSTTIYFIALIVALLFLGYKKLKREI